MGDVVSSLGEEREPQRVKREELVEGVSICQLMEHREEWVGRLEGDLKQNTPPQIGHVKSTELRHIKTTNLPFILAVLNAKDYANSTEELGQINPAGHFACQRKSLFCPSSTSTILEGLEVGQPVNASSC